MKYTPWFRGTVAPHRTGYYEVKRTGVLPAYPAHTMLFYDGQNWFHTEHSSAGKFPRSCALMEASDCWRGSRVPL